MILGHTETEKKKMERALKRLEKCNGDCKNCSKCNIYMSHSATEKNVVYYAFGCDVLPQEMFESISSTMGGLKKEAVETLKFELS